MSNNNPIESTRLPGYFEISGFSRYVVNPSGEVLNIRNLKTLNGSFNPAGYKNFRLIGDDRKTLTWGRHRLLAFVFKHPGKDISALVVNHDNGIKGDDRLDNLEWVTEQGNVEHAGRTGLSNKCLPISVRDADTGIVTDYPSIMEYARISGLSKDAVNYRVRIGGGRVFPERKQYRYSRIKRPWYVPIDIDREVKKNGTSKSVMIRHLLTMEVREFGKLSQLAKVLDVSPSVITGWISQKDQPVLPGFIQMKWSYDPAPWRFVEDIHAEYQNFTSQRCVVILEAATGIETIFLTARKCAMSQGISPTALDYRLKSNGKTVFKDGFSYRYYSKKKEISPVKLETLDSNSL